MRLLGRGVGKAEKILAKEASGKRRRRRGRGKQRGNNGDVR